MTIWSWRLMDCITKKHRHRTCSMNFDTFVVTFWWYFCWILFGWKRGFYLLKQLDTVFWLWTEMAVIEFRVPNFSTLWSLSFCGYLFFCFTYASLRSDPYIIWAYFHPHSSPMNISLYGNQPLPFPRNRHGVVSPSLVLVLWASRRVCGDADATIGSGRELREILHEGRYGYSPWKTNIAPENRVSQKESHLPTIHFSGAMLNFGGVSGQILTTKSPNWWWLNEGKSPSKMPEMFRFRSYKIMKGITLYHTNCSCFFYLPVLIKITPNVKKIPL